MSHRKRIIAILGGAQAATTPSDHPDETCSTWTTTPERLNVLELVLAGNYREALHVLRRMQRIEQGESTEDQ